MDIIISAPQGAGKTMAAMKLLMAYFDVAHYSVIEDSILHISQTDDFDSILDTLKTAKHNGHSYKAVLFDGFGADKIKQAQWIIYQYRRMCPDKLYEKPFIAIYCTQDKTYLA